MTEESSPAGERRELAAQPELRASHADRDRAVEVLETDDLTVRRGDIKIRHAADQVPVTLTVLVSGQVRGGDVVAMGPPRAAAVPFAD
jgi:hypothetical protein